MREVSRAIARKNGRINCPEIEDLYTLWSRVQYAQNGYSASFREFGKANSLPDVTKLFRQAKIRDGLIHSNRYQSQVNFDLQMYPQTSYGHVISLTFLGAQILAKANGKLQPPLNKELLTKALMVHNVPKGLGARDVPYEKKEVADDMYEYGLFRNEIANLYKNNDDRLQVQKIYLLQFCLGDINNRWPLVARNLMDNCRRNYWREIMWFKFIERFDYLIYAFEQYVGLKTTKLISKIAKVQVPLINELKSKQPDLRLIWTPTVNDYFCQFIN